MTDRLDAMRSRVDGVCDAFVEDPSWDSCRHCSHLPIRHDLKVALAEIDTLRQRVETAEQERDKARNEIAELHDIVSAYDAITDPTEHSDLNERAFQALTGEGADHTICRMLEAAEALIMELEAERDARG